jgi:thymidylate synthase
MSKMDDIYSMMLQELITNGRKRGDRTGVGTRSIFGFQYRIDLQKDGFPILTTKAIKYNNIFEELMWFLSGSTNANDLKAKGVNIWNEWAAEDGDLGPIYGKQFTNWRGINQFEALVDGLIHRPYSRRHILSAWNVADLPDERKTPQQNVAKGKMALAPCHVLYQFYVRAELDGKMYIDCMMTQRSADVFLGLPYNICSVATLLYVLSMATGYTPGEVIHSIGDLHLYENHTEQAKLQITREGRPAPKFMLTAEEGKEGDPILDWELIGYNPHPTISAKVAV